MPKIVIVVGMHRSGTSLLSLFLNDLGVNMGDKTLPSTSANPTGHHEDLFFLNLHSKILNNCKGDWDSPPESSLLNKAWKKHTKLVKQEIASRNKKNIVWGWKDPRTSLFLENYIDLIDSPLIIYCTRGSSDVENSIYVRNKISNAHSSLLKKHYDNEISRTLKKHPDLKVLGIDFDLMIKNPQKTIEMLESFLGLRLENEEYLIKKILNKKDIKKIKTKYKNIERMKLAMKAIRRPITAKNILSLRIKRRKWRKSWYNHNV